MNQCLVFDFFFSCTPCGHNSFSLGTGAHLDRIIMQMGFSQANRQIIIGTNDVTIKPFNILRLFGTSRYSNCNIAKPQRNAPSPAWTRLDCILGKCRHILFYRINLVTAIRSANRASFENTLFEMNRCYRQFLDQY